MKMAGWVLLLCSFAVILLETVIVANILNEITAMTTEGSVSVTINDLGADTTVPAVTIQVPADGALFSENDSVSIEVQVTDASAISVVFANITLPDATVSQVTLTDGDSDNVFTGTFTSTILNGTYTLQAVANDSSNNVNNSKSVQFTVQDFTPPAPPAPAAVGVGGGGATRSAGIGRTVPVQPTLDVPPPSVFRKRSVSPRSEAPSVAPTVLQKVLQVPRQALIMLKELPAVFVDRSRVMTAVMLFTAVNAVVALALVSFAVVRMLSLLRR